MRVVVVGGAGQVGRQLVRIARGRGDWVGATYKARRPIDPNLVSEPLDKADAGAARNVLERMRPELVIDTGALHNVDYCETHPAESDQVNRDGSRRLAEAARAVGAKYVFVSTDFVFDGTGGPPYAEESEPRPQSIYARSKLEGEAAVLSVNPTNLVVRPSVIYSWLDTRDRAESSSGKGLNFGTWVAEEVARGREVRIVNDQVASPTLASDLAGAIFALVDGDHFGVYHAAGATATDRYAFVRALVRRLRLDESLVIPVSTAELKQKALRPSNSSLSSERLTRDTGYRTLGLSESLDHFADDYLQDPGAPRPK